MAQLFTNNASATLASGITASDTSLTVASGKGALFPSPSGSDYAILTLTQAGSTETSWEEVYLTARSGDVLTVQRARESSTALAWASGSKVELRITAQALNYFQLGAQAGFDYANVGFTYFDKNMTIQRLRIDKLGPAAKYIPVAYTLSNGTVNYGLDGLGGDANRLLIMTVEGSVLTIPPNSATGFKPGSSFRIFYNTAGSGTIVSGASIVRLYRSGVGTQSGPRTLDSCALATLTYVGTDNSGYERWIADGNGVT